jgi:threonine/homoserine/homoserine lactone efflux protein
MDPRAILDHEFVVAAYTITWVIQLGYLAWLGLKWRAQKRDAERLRKASQ